MDSADDFLNEMPNLHRHEQGQVLQVFVLTAVLDGRFCGAEKKLYRQLIDACDGSFACHESYICYVAQLLRDTKPLHYMDLKHCVHWEPDDGAHELTVMYYALECVHRVFSFCTC